MFVNTDTQMKSDLESYNAMAYYRLSKEDGSHHESDSISNQRKLIHAFLENNQNIKLVDEAYDDGYTGTNFDRPGFRAVLDAIHAGRINCVIVKDLSRLGREYIETGKYLEMIFPSLGVRFIAINDDVDSENSHSGDDIMIPVKNIMNEAYCRDLSRKLRRQFRIQRSNGEYMGSFVSYGYCKSPDDKHKLVIDEYAAEVVRGMFSLKVKGCSQQTIADFLNREQILPPAQYKKSLGLRYQSGFQCHQDGKWSPVAVTRILKNPIYIGTLVQGKRGTPNYKLKMMRERKPEDWVVVKNNHEPIIDDLVFTTVQRMLERDMRTPPKKEAVLPLAGVLFCPDCHRSMCRRSVTRGSRKFFYYVCSTHKRGKGCSSHSLEQKKLETTILHAIENQICAIVETDRLMKEAGQSNIWNMRAKRLNLLIAQKEKEIDGYQDFRMKLYEALSDELIDRDEYDKMRRKYTELIEEANAVADKLKAQRKELLSGIGSDTSWVELFIKYRGANTLNHEMVATLIDRIYIYENKHVKIEFNYRDELAYYQDILKTAAKEVG